MSWEDLFREIETGRKQIEERKKGEAKEEERKKTEREEIVRKFHGRVENVIRRFSKATGWKIKETEYGSGVWQEAYDYYSEHYPTSIVQIDPSGISVFRDVNIPLSDFTEETLATALVKVWNGLKRGQS
jgi:hypothetical protein